MYLQQKVFVGFLLVTLRVPGFAATWCYSVEWNIAAADGAEVRGVMHGTMH